MFSNCYIISINILQNCNWVFKRSNQRSLFDYAFLALVNVLMRYGQFVHIRLQWKLGEEHTLWKQFASSWAHHRVFIDLDLQMSERFYGWLQCKQMTIKWFTARISSPFAVFVILWGRPMAKSVHLDFLSYSSSLPEDVCEISGRI